VVTGQRPEQPAPPGAAGRLELPAEAASAARARQFIHGFATDRSLPEETVDRLVLIGGELVTNAVLHARTPLDVALELHADRVRVSVHDRSRAPASLRRYQPDALTGRGLGLVAALSREWGVAVTRDGKRVWADIERDAGRRQPGRRTRRRQPVQPAPVRAAPGSHLVRFLGVPVGAYLELQQHNDALFRELELIGVELGSGDAAPMPERLVRLVEEFRARFPGVPDGYRNPVAAADARGAATVDLEVRLAPALVPAARAYVDLLERADELCRSGAMLTQPPSEAVRSLRRWFIDELTAQLLDHAPPTPAGGARGRR
jgi:anti-sigma regulatory factor (Ser/Thr protein kinase)